MPPKRPLADPSSTDESDVGKRVRKSARTAAVAGSETPAANADLKADPPQPLSPSDKDEAPASSPSTLVHSDEERGPAPEPGPSIDPPSSAAQLDASEPATVETVRTLFSLIDYVPDDTVQRLLPFARKFDEANHRFALSTIPSNATWGSTGTTDKFLCVDNQPITVWMVGNTESPWFVDLKGDPHARVNLGIRLPFEGDFAVITNLYEKARPKRTDFKDVVYSAHKMSRYNGKTGSTIAPFKHVYDATDRFRAKSDMPVLPASVIGKCDIVLVESFFTRWRTDLEKQDRRKWTRWNVGFELQAVSLLYEAPPHLVEELEQEPEPVPILDDDM